MSPDCLKISLQVKAIDCT